MTGYVGRGSGIVGLYLACLYFFATDFYQEKIEGLAGEAKTKLKENHLVFT